jgi:dsDNA-specific endonuclease/ATPase MutS2
MFLSENIMRSLQEIFLQYKSILLVDLITAITKNREHIKFKDLFKEAGYGLYLSNGRI